MSRHRTCAAVLVIGTAIVPLGCGGDDTPPASEGSQSGTSAAAPAGGGVVDIKDLAFAPTTVTVAAGSPLTVTNRDTTSHTATADDGHSFDTGRISPGASRAIALKQSGHFAYHCSIHPFMHGTIVVGAASR